MINKNPQINDIIQRLKNQAENGAMANNIAMNSKNWKAEDFQSWHDAVTIEKVLNASVT